MGGARLQAGSGEFTFADVFYQGTTSVVPTSLSFVITSGPALRDREGSAFVASRKKKQISRANCRRS